MMLVVDRNSFMAWVGGALLIRDRAGSCIVGDDVRNEEAEAAMQRGETIGLSVNGRIVSTMRDIGDAYEEEIVI